MQQKVNWAKIKIPPFGMSDGMVKYKNGNISEDDWNEKPKKQAARDRNGKQKG